MAQHASAVAVRPASPLSVTDQDMAAIFERVVVGGDLSQLSGPERAQYYLSLCESQRLDWRTKPFEYLMLDDKLILYALRNCTDQLRKRDGISVEIVSREVVDGVYVVTARATAPNGRTDESIGAVPLVKEGGTWKTNQNGKRYLESDGTVIALRPDERANAMKKGETQAKRRVTLSMGGLSMLDESELEGIEERRIRRVQVDLSTGEIRPPATIREVRPAADEPIGVATDEASAANADALTERTATAIKNQAAFLKLSEQDVNDLAVASFNIPDASALTEIQGLLVKKLLDNARHVNGAMVTSRMDKIWSDIGKDPDADFLLESRWLLERFNAKLAELEAKAAQGQSGGR